MSSEKKPVPDALSNEEDKSKKSPEEDHLVMLTSLVPALLWRADPTGTDISLTKQWEEYTGQSREDTQGWGWLKAIHPEDLDRAARTFRKAFENGEPIELEQRIRSSSGAYRWFQVRHRPAHDEEGKITAWFGAAVDIEERKQAEEALRASEQKFASLFATSPLPFLVLKPDPPDFTITAANAAYYAATLTTPETLIGRRFFDVFPDDPSRPGQPGSDALAISLDIVLSTKRSDTMKRVRYDIRTPEGRFEPHWWEATNAPLLDAAGNVTAIIHQVIRVTELHLAEQMVRQKEEKYRTQLEHDVRDRTVELNANKERLQATMDASMDMIQVFKAVRNDSGEIIDFVWILNNAASEKVYGDIIGESLLKNNPGVVEEGIFDTLKQVVETGVSDQSERHYVHEQFDGWFYQSAVKLGDGVATTTTNITIRKKAELEVQQSKRLLQDVIDAPRIGMAVYKAIRNKKGEIADFVHEYINKASIDMLGEDFTGKLFTDHGENALSQMGQFIEVIEKEKRNSYVKEANFRGRKVWFAITNTPLDNERLVHTWEDITERKKAEEEVKEQAHFISGITEMMPDVVSVIELPSRNIVFTNRDTLVWTGFDANDLSFEDRSKLMHADDLPAVRSFYEGFASLKDHEENKVEYRLKNKDGDWVLLSLRGKIFRRDGEGVPIQLLLVGQNITAQKKAEQQILRLKDEVAQKATDKYETLFNSIDEGFGIIEMLYNDEGKPIDYVFHEVNNVYERLTGQVDPSGKLGSEVSPNIEPYWLHTYDKVVRTGESIRHESYHGDTGRWYAAFASRIGTEGSRMLAIVFNDITERKQQEERQEYLLKLNDLLRLTTYAAEIEGKITAHAMEYFGADRCYYCDIEDGYAITLCDARNPGLPSVVGSYPLSGYPILQRVLDNLLPFIVDDVSTSTILDASLKELCIGLNIISFIVVPVVKNNTLKGAICLAQAAPRSWKEAEINLLFVTAERAWAEIERAKTEEALKASQKRFQSIANLVPDLLWDSEPDGATNWYNQRWLEYTGQNFEQAVGWEWVDAIHPDDREGSAKRYREAVEAGKPLRQEHRIRRFDGEYRWFVVNASPLKDESGHVVKMYGSATDIHDSKQAEEALRKSEEKYRTLFETMGQGYAELEIIRGSDGRAADIRYLELNPQYEHLTGIPVVEARGRTVLEMIPDLDDWWIQEYDRIVRSGSPGIVENEVTSSGRWYEAKIYPRAGDRFSVLSEEITVRKMAEAALRKSEERQAFLLQLSDALRPLSNPTEIQHMAMQVLGQRLGVNRAQYYLADETGEYLSSAGGYTDGVPAAVGRFRLIEFGRYAYDGFHTGQTQVVSDATTDPRISEAVLRSYNEVGFLAYIGVPFVQRGRLIGTVAVHQSGPRLWTDDERIMVEETTERAGIAIERARAEEALRENEERFRTLANAVPQVMWSNDGKGVANYFNRRWYEYSGLSFEQSVGLGWEAIVHPEDAPSSKGKWHTALAAGEVFDTEYRLRRFDGVYRWHIGRNVPLKDREERVIGWFGTATDIEELKQAQTALYYSEERYRIALASAKMAAWDWNILEDRIQWNDQHYYLFGIEPDGKEKKAADFVHFVHPQDKALVASALKEAMEVSGVYKAEFRIIRADGEVCWMSGYGRVVEFQEGKATRMTGVMYDITQQQLFTQELERLVRERTLELQQSNESLQQFATIAAHDLQEPLRKMRLFVSTVQRFKENLPSKGQESLEKLTATSERMSRLIQEVLQYSKVMARDRKFMPTDLDRVIRNILADLEVKIEETGAEIFYKDALPTIEAVPPQMNQLFYNLLTNALKYRHKGISPVIQIASQPLSLDELSTYPHLLLDKVYQKIRISDNGIGFEPEYAEQIFQLFERLHSEDEYEGTGVGLALCKKIVENHHGHIFAESIEGEGATFYLILPLNQ